MSLTKAFGRPNTTTPQPSGQGVPLQSQTPPPLSPQGRESLSKAKHHHPSALSLGLGGWRGPLSPKKTGQGNRHQQTYNLN